MKLTITADAYALTSDIKVKDIELLKKYNPDALQIKDEEGNTKFAVSYSEGKPSVAAFGVTFGGKTRDENGYATITGTIPSDLKTTEAAKDFVAEKFGGVVAYLREIERTITSAADKVMTTRKELADSITVA